MFNSDFGKWASSGVDITFSWESEQHSASYPHQKLPGTTKDYEAPPSYPVFGAALTMVPMLAPQFWGTLPCAEGGAEGAAGTTRAESASALSQLRQLEVCGIGGWNFEGQTSPKRARVAYIHMYTNKSKYKGHIHINVDIYIIISRERENIHISYKYLDHPWTGKVFCFFPMKQGYIDVVVWETSMFYFLL